MNTEKYFKALADKWPSAIVAREEIHYFTGGLISSGYIANLDCIGKGPEAIRIGRKICYPVQPLIEWLKARAASTDNFTKNACNGSNQQAREIK